MQAVGPSLKRSLVYLTMGIGVGEARGFLLNINVGEQITEQVEQPKGLTASRNTPKAERD